MNIAHCEYEPCLECPLPKCRLEGGVVAQRDQRIIRLHKQGKDNAFISEALGCSVRTIYRVVKRAG